MTDTVKILRHIAELYAKPRKDQPFDDAVLELEEKLNNRFDAYDESFSVELTSNIIKAIDDFWRYKSDKNRPTIAQIMAMVNSDDKKTESEPVKRPMPENMTDYAMAFMQRDVKLGRNRHLLPVYQKAVRYIAEELLSREMPASEWRKLSLGERCAKAMALGLFNRFDEILVLVCRKWYGKDYQYPSANMLQGGQNQGSGEKAVQRLASHYRANEAEMASAARM